MAQQVDAVVAGNITLCGIGLKASERIRYQLLYPNPEYSKSFIIKRSTDGIEEWLSSMVEYPDGTIEVPRGAVKELKTALAECDMEPRWIDKRSMGEPLLGEGVGILRLSLPIPLRAYQQEALDAMTKHLQGMVIIPCGGGKTRLGVAAIQAVGRSAIIIVHTDFLMDQWTEEIEEKLGVKAGRVDGNREEWKPITVAMNKSLANRIAETPDGFGPWSNFGMCIVDEAHHAPAATYQKVLQRIPARWRLGLTATERDDGMNKPMEWSFGTRLKEVESRFLIKNGWLVPAEIVEVETNFEFDYDGPDRKKMAALTKAIISDPRRNVQIAEIAAREGAMGETVLVLSNNKSHCRKLGQIIESMGTKATVLIGSVSKKDRKEGPIEENVRRTKKQRKAAIVGLLDGTERVVVATSLADEGLNVPNLSRIVLALPGSSNRATKQQIGRSMRPVQGKYPKLYDFVDRKVDTLVTRFKNRRRAYKDLGLL